MSNKIEPRCIECQKTETLLWRQAETGEGEICLDCYEQKEAKYLLESNASSIDLDKTNDELKKLKDAKDSNEGRQATTAEEKKLRKSTRSTRFKAKGSNLSTNTTVPNCNVQSIANNAKVQNKGRSRRNIFKKIPFKTPVVQATTHPVESVFYKGSYLQVGDIVSLMDDKQNIYYAQIRGLLVDNFCEKSAFLTWLIPTQASPDPHNGFDPASYLIGPDEELSRKLSALQFIMHAPSNYYYDRTTPFPIPDAMDVDGKTRGFIWTTLPEFKRRSEL
ncbi:PREDICTED: GATA zinc finger domain-containing protein 1 [Rhagoletis zephyria]|uniref:GATA zinc finger domain-containing protein 1 n=1 Tax=Rhagoletis zephyria TaxID=28612 RepID=UPI0008113787|nr:PREDICTED: GATA zinc finger domain-containing protein 1 [Rhagoletis zephyria]